MWPVLVFVVLVVLGLGFAVMHHLRLYAGNFWEHMEWLCFGVAIGLAFIAIAPNTEPNKSKLIFEGGTVALFGHLFMYIISLGVMRLLGHTPSDDSGNDEDDEPYHNRPTASKHPIGLDE